MKDKKTVQEYTDTGVAKPEAPVLSGSEATTLMQALHCLEALATPDMEDILREKIGNSFNISVFDLFIAKKKLQQIIDTSKEQQRLNEVGTIVDMLMQPQAMPTEEKL